MKENKRPVCECGEELLLHKSYVENNYYTITLDGDRISKKQHHEDNLPEYTDEKIGLICLKCGNYYNVKKENNIFKRLDKV